MPFSLETNVFLTDSACTTSDDEHAYCRDGDIRTDFSPEESLQGSSIAQRGGIALELEDDLCCLEPDPQL